MPHAHVPSSPSLCHSPPKSSSSSISLRISGEQEVVTSCLFLSFHANYSQRLWVDIYIGGRRRTCQSPSLMHRHRKSSHHFLSEKVGRSGNQAETACSCNICSPLRSVQGFKNHSLKCTGRTSKKSRDAFARWWSLHLSLFPKKSTLGQISQQRSGAHKFPGGINSALERFVEEL